MCEVYALVLVDEMVAEIQKKEYLIYEKALATHTHKHIHKYEFVYIIKYPNLKYI